MGSIEVTRAELEEAGKHLAEAGPVYMVNMVRYRDQADYQGKSKLPPCSGREAYFQRYAPAFNKVAAAQTMDCSGSAMCVACWLAVKERSGTTSSSCAIRVLPRFGESSTAPPTKSKPRRIGGPLWRIGDSS